MLITDVYPDVVESPIRARLRAEGHMEAADAAGFPWGEETVTEILVAASPSPDCHCGLQQAPRGSRGCGLALVVGR